jgi:transcriptional repressor NrdR
MVVKKDGRREEFDPHKLIDGIRKACAKRPVSTEDVEQMVGEIESDLVRRGGSEVPAQYIGELVMTRLRELDEVAYVRFASVYRQFKDVDSLAEEIAELKEWKRRAILEKVQPRLIT